MQVQKRRGVRRTILGRLGRRAFFRNGHQGRHQDQGGHQHHQDPHGEDYPQFRQALEAHERQGHKGDDGGHAGVDNPRGGAAKGAGHDPGAAMARRAFLFFQAAKPVDAVVDGEAQHEGREDQGEEVEVPHHQGDQPKGPTETQDQHQPLHQGAPQAPEKQDQQSHLAQQG